MSNELNQMIEKIKKEIQEGGIIYEVNENGHTLSLEGAPWITECADNLDTAIQKMAEYSILPAGRNVFQSWAGVFFAA